MTIKLPSKIAPLAAKVGAKASKYGPHVALGAGILAATAGTVLACKQTLNIDKLLTEHEEKLADIIILSEQDRPDYTKEDAEQDKRVLKARTAGRIVRNYAPAAGLFFGGIALICVSHKIMTDRVVQLGAAAEAANLGLQELKARVKQEMGEDAAQKLMQPKRESKSEGNDPHDEWAAVDAYGAEFDRFNPNYTGIVESDRLFLHTQEKWANDKLQASGHLFLNEVYDMLGMPHTPAGAVCGWLLHGSGDGYVDFGEFAGEFAEWDDPETGARVYFICPNVDGVIYDKI